MTFKRIEFICYALIVGFFTAFMVWVLVSCSWISGPKTYNTSEVAYSGPMDGLFAGSVPLMYEWGWVKACMGVEQPVAVPIVKIYKCPEMKEGEGCLVPCNGKFERTCYDKDSKTVSMPNKTADYPLLHQDFVRYISDQTGSFNAEYLEKCKGSN